MSAAPSLPDVTSVPETIDGSPPVAEDDREIVPPGVYLLELSFTRPCFERVLRIGLEKAGLEKLRIDLRSDSATLLGHLPRAMELVSSDALRWTDLYAFQEIDPFAPFEGGELAAEQMDTHRTYEARFISRMTTGAGKRVPPWSRAQAIADLERTGFRVQHLFLLEKDTRDPNRKQSSISDWIGVLVWDRKLSYITEDENLFFTQIRPVT